MDSAKECCGNCKYGSYDKVKGYMCVNDDSEYVSDFTEGDFYVTNM